MARATINIIPNRKQMEAWGYDSDNIASGYAFLAKVFSKPRIKVSVSRDGGILGEEGWVCMGLGVYPNSGDGIGVPFEWCKVTHLSEEDKYELARYNPTEAAEAKAKAEEVIATRRAEK